MTMPNTNETVSRRSFLKLTSASVMSAAAAAASVGMTAEDVMAKSYDDFPVPLSKDFAPHSQRDLVLTRAAAGINPELTKMLKQVGNREPQEDIPGYSQLDNALTAASWAVHDVLMPGDSAGITNTGVNSWDLYNKDKNSNAFQFENPQHASIAIKKAAQSFGAINCGIARRDERWDYKEFFSPGRGSFGWEDFPFEPKSVIVMAVPMDYHMISTSPAWTSSGTVGDGYSRMAKVATCIAQFMRGLGYNAICAGNSMANSVAYGIMAGLGEGGRNGALIMPKHGPRFRICKVYTDFEGAEYDKPMTFGVASFCERCKRCADACPSKAIPHDDKPSFMPTYSTNPDETWNNQKGIYKYYSNSKKCLKFWGENGNDCSNCISSCPYNKPDFWHHRLVDVMNTISPGAVHTMMREMDILFGYGKVGDPEKVVKFWSTAEF
ncbi:hypothetical protein SP90_01675 [Halodesulfovibrio spirochaetisodalis]|uniref:4Fe-4S ferredoxin-type domain-containing protein n=2 Tax=Halodesulfovibrio spirochaetisodalis TaxID=1560234 RepID=A0A1B7XMT8_9BACT|nr:hypothetical protein SP90_01675 [Halodesulfovibrio spirochaetisodalis]